MGPITLILAGLAVLACGSTAMLLLRNRGQRRALGTIAAQRDRALAAEAASTRLLRLSATELRETALTLLGHTDRLRAQDCGSAASHATAIAAVTARVLNLADDLQDSAVPGAETRVIRDEPLVAGPLLRDAIAAVSATLDPSRRHWRVSRSGRTPRRSTGCRNGRPRSGSGRPPAGSAGSPAMDDRGR